MLHQIDNSKLRSALLKIVEMQRRLVIALCEPATAAADVCPRWLDDVWRGIDTGIGPDFVSGFCGHQNGPRYNAMRAMADAAAADKLHMRTVLESQLEFACLYDDRPAHRLLPLDGTREPFTSMRRLMEDFYDEWLQNKPERGYPFVSGAMRLTDLSESFRPLPVCPYCDGTMRTLQIDHVLPKSLYPCLSCHPDNLAPVCGDCNSVHVKGNKAPLTPTVAEVVNEWFHPYLRSGHKLLQAKPEKRSDRTLTLTLTAETPDNHQRAQKLDGLLRLTSFWGADLEGDIRSLPMRAKPLRECTSVTASDVRSYCHNQARINVDFRGKDHLSIYHEGLHRFVAEDEDLIADIVLQYEEDERAKRENVQLRSI